MPLTLQFPLTIEQHLREHATQQGVSLENYVMQLLALNSRKKETSKRKKDFTDRKSTRLNSSHPRLSRMPSSA